MAEPDDSPPPCQCGHAQDEHASSGGYAWDGLGECWYELTAAPPTFCACKAFVAVE